MPRLLKNERLGLTACCALLSGFAVDFTLFKYSAATLCEEPPYSALHRVDRGALLLMTASAVFALLGLYFDPRKQFALSALLLFVPLMMIAMLHSLCGDI